MIYFGSRTETASQLRQVLKSEDLTDVQMLQMSREYMKHLDLIHGGVTLKAANKIFIAQSLNPLDEFQSILSQTFGSSSAKVDFSKTAEAAENINSFVEENTNKLVKDLIQPSDLDSLTRLVLVNVIYFKGSWKQQFDKSQTYSDTFLGRNDERITTEMMSITNRMFVLKNKPSGLKARTCELLYQEGKVAMTVILPDEGVPIEEVEAQLNGNVLNEVLSRDEISRPVNLFIPKFKIEFKAEVSINNSLILKDNSLSEFKVMLL